MNKIKVAVIGGGSIAQIGHLPYYQKHPSVELVAVVDANLERALEVANKFGAKRAYADAEEMFRQEKPDAVSICTTNQSHAPLALLAFEHGADALVEKPLAIHPEEAQRVVESAHQADRICMVGMTHRFRNESRAVKRLVDAGNLGDVYYARARILRRRGTPTGWFTDKSKSGGGPLMDIGVHALDLAWWFLGQPAPLAVSGQLVRGIGRYQTKMSSTWKSADAANQDNSVFDVEDFASAYLRFQNGLVVHLEVSWALNGPQDDAVKVDLFGSKGGITLAPLKFYCEQNDILLESDLVIEKNDPFEDEINHFVNSVLQRSEPLCSAEQGLRILEMLDAITVSSEKRREVVFE